MTKPIDRVLDRVEVQGISGGWHQAKCPAHDDSRPSLGIKEGDTGAVLLSCHKGCDKLDVVRSMGLDWPDLFPDDADANWKPWDGTKVATYDYVDTSGEVLFQVERYEMKDPSHPAYGEKQFIQRVPGKKGGPSQNNVERVPYRLPEVQNAIENGTPILYVEGEKVVQAGEELGFVATCSPGGANAHYESVYNHLDGAKVLILPDNDEPGREYARKAAERLLPRADMVKVVELPGLSPKDDLVEWIENGGTREELIELANAAPIYKTNSNGQSSDGKSSSDGTVTAKNSDAVTANSGSNGHNGGNSGGSDGSDGKSSQFEKGDGKQCDIIRNLARNDGVEMFSTPEGKVFASFQVDDHRETWPAESEVTRMHLMRLYYGHAGRTPSEQALKDATRMLKADAVFEHDVQEVHTRVGRGSDGALYVDLCGPKWRAVRMTAEGWEVVSNPAVRFRRSRSMMQLPEPAEKGDISELRRFVNATSTAWILVVAWLVAAFRPEGPYPVLVLQGEQGSAKSTLARFLRSLIDPSAAMLRSVSRSTRDLMITAMNSHVLAFDNLSGLKPWLQDALCTLSTGGGFATRELHTDTNEIIFSATRPIVLTGIEDIATRDDLAERSLILELNAISPSKRKPERDLNSDFADAAPAIMAGLFDALVAAERRIDSTTVEDAPRMADFAEWVVAAEPALPWDDGDFIATYDENREAAVLDNININPLARGICELIEGRFSNSWDGTPTELKDELDEIVPDNEQDASAYPGSASWVTRKLRRVKPMLRKAGIEVEDYRTNGKRKIRITLDSQSKENAVTAVTDGEKSPSDGAEATKESDGKDYNAVTDAVTDGGNSDGIEAPF